VAEAFATDTLSRLAALKDGQIEQDARAARDSVEVRLALGDSSADPSPIARLAADLGLAVEEQGEGDLGDRMARLVGRGLASGHSTVLVGTDAPDLPLDLLREAFEALGRVDAVVAPSRDGGYVLVGASRAVPTLFRIDAPWSSERVFAATCESLDRAGCAFEVLTAWDDVDDAAALGRLASRLDSGTVAPATERLLETFRRQGVGF